MKVQSNLLDKLVKFAGRNLVETPKNEVDLDVGKPLRVNGKDFLVMSWSISGSSGGQIVNLQLNEIIDGKVVR